MISSKSRRRVCVFRSASGEQPKASMTHSTPFMGCTWPGEWPAISAVAARSRLGLAAFGAELCRTRNLFAALGAELCSCASGPAGCRRRLLRRSRLLLSLSRILHGIRHRLADGHSRAETCADSDSTAAFIGRGDRNRLSDFVLREFAHVADHVQADALIEDLLQLVGQRKIFDVEGVEREAVVAERGRKLLGDFLRENALVR